MVFGFRPRFAVEVGAREADMCAVDVWVGGVRLTGRDNAAYVPSLLSALRAFLAAELPPLPSPGRPAAEVFAALRTYAAPLVWDEILDGVSLYACRDGDDVALYFASADGPGPVHDVRVPAGVFTGILRAAVSALERPEAG